MNLTAILGRQRLGQIQMDIEHQRHKSMPRRYKGDVRWALI
ncbi:hypothetical protein N9506_05165 [Pseudomonadales bacterium]|nr:hypothetical protein [Pseudomonadales bacterium]